MPLSSAGDVAAYIAAASRPISKSRSCVAAKSKAIWGSDPVALTYALTVKASEHFQGGLEVNTQSTYCSGVRSWELFCSETNRQQKYPADQNSLMLFASWSAERISAKSIELYITAIRSHHVALGHELPSPDLMPLLKRSLRGIAYSHRRDKKGGLRMAICFDVLKRMHAAIKTMAEPVDIYSLLSPVLLKAVFDTAFFTAARPSEVSVRNTSVGKSAPLRLAHLKWFDMDTDQPGGVILQPKTKNDQFGERCEMIFGLSGDPEVCAYKSLHAWLDARTDAGEILTEDSLLFPVRGLKSPTLVPLSYGMFRHSIRHVLKLAGYTEQAIHVGYSFRCGAATTLAQNNASDSTIMAVGRWKSAAYLLYLRQSQALRKKTSSLMTSRSE
jgi:hypothetical protein